MPFTALARWRERRFQWRRRLQAGGRHEKETRFGGRRRLERGPRRTLSGRWTSPCGGGWGGHGDGVPDHRAPGSRCPRGPSVGSPRGGPLAPRARGLRLLPAGLAAAGPSPGAGSLADTAPASLPPAAAACRPISQPPAHASASGLQPPRPRRGPTARTAGPGTPWAGPIPGSPLTASQSWVGKGSLARRRLRAGRQVSAGTGRDAGRDPCLVPTHFRPRPCREGRVPGSPVPQTPSPGPPRVLPGSPPGPRLRQPAAPL